MSAYIYICTLYRAAAAKAMAKFKMFEDSVDVGKVADQTQQPTDKIIKDKDAFIFTAFDK